MVIAVDIDEKRLELAKTLGADAALISGDDVPEKVRELREKHQILVGGCPGNKNIMRLMPPLVITEQELAHGLEAMA